ncbi:oligosaccharide repeat unit polymerase [Clostridium sp.]
MGVIIFDILVIILILIQYNREKNWINMISVLTAPYALFATLNNFLFTKFGFYEISENTFIMLGCSFVIFFVGGFAFNANIQRQHEEYNSHILEGYNLKNMICMLYFIAVCGVIKLVLAVLSGAFSMEALSGTEGLMGGGIVGHLLLVSYSIVPIIFLAFLEEKKISYLIPVLLIAAITFASLIKNNIIGLIISIFLFVTRYKKSVVKKAVIICLCVVVTVFFGNYFLTFFIHKSNVASTFYTNQLFVYCSGSMINDNLIFTKGIRVDTDFIYKLMTALLGLPNMFITFIYGSPAFPFESLSEMPVGNVYGQTSNVVDSFGYFYPSKGDFCDLMNYGMFVFIVGFVFSYIYYKSSFVKKRFNVFICNFMTYFVAFSFFGTFYILSAPWEILIYSLIVPNMFYKLRESKTI